MFQARLFLSGMDKWRASAQVKWLNRERYTMFVRGLFGIFERGENHEGRETMEISSYMVKLENVRSTVNKNKTTYL